MPSAQTRSPKSKATPGMTGRGTTATATVKSKGGNSKGRPGSGAALSVHERERLVAQAAYFRAEKRGFAPGCELQDWVEAEAEVLRLIGGA
jgi:hypothetical protein